MFSVVELTTENAVYAQLDYVKSSMLLKVKQVYLRPGEMVAGTGEKEKPFMA